IVAWRAFSRGLGLVDLGLTTADPWRSAWIALALTGLLCANQFASLRMMARIPDEQRGSLFRLTEKIMPRTISESVVFTALACTAGLSEEFLYRGFAFAVFKRIFVKPTFSIPIA